MSDRQSKTGQTYLYPTMRRGIIHGREVVYSLKVVLALLALESNADELLWSQRADILRDAFYPGKEIILRIQNGGSTLCLWLVGQLPRHYGRIFGIDSPIDRVLSTHHSLDMSLVPLLCLCVTIHLVRKVSKFGIWRGIDAFFRVVSPASTGCFALRRCCEIPGGLHI